MDPSGGLDVAAKTKLRPSGEMKLGRPTSSQSVLLIYFFTYSLAPWCRILFEKLIVTQLIKKYPAFFMEPESSSSCSQKAANGLYSEPAESSSSHRSLSP
jgi:hypothetical protein